MQHLRKSVARCQLQRMWWLCPYGAASGYSSRSFSQLLPSCFFSQMIQFLDSCNFWGFQHTFGFILTPSHIALWGAHCLTSQIWNLGESLFNPTTLAFGTYFKPVPHEWWQSLLSLRAVARISPFLAAEAKSWIAVHSEFHSEEQILYAAIILEHVALRLSSQNKVF